MFDYLSDRLQSGIQKLRGLDKITEDNIQASLAQIKEELLEADVSLKAIKLFTTRVTEAALGANVIRGVKPGEQLVKIIHEALAEVLGSGLIADKQNAEEKLPSFDLISNTGAILLLGLQGSGKTTTAAKLAYFAKQKGRRPLLVACDLQRPSAVKQLEILANQAEVDFCSADNIFDLVDVAFVYAEQHNNDLLIFDTAGRLQIDTDLMAELLILEKQISSRLQMDKLLVIDSLIGQEAANVAQSFDTQIGLTGIVLSKLDADSRGGAALSVVEATQKPILFAATGEKLVDLERFYPERMASRILGMADVLTLVERAQSKIDEEESKRLEAELMKGNFNYQTFITAQNMFSKLGDFAQVFKMMGMGSMLSQMGLGSSQQGALMEQSKDKLAKFKSAISSMTPEERIKPELLSNHSSARSRKTRIAKGSGLQAVDLDKLTAEFTKMAKLFKTISPMLAMGANSNINPLDLVAANLPKKQRQILQANPRIKTTAKAPKTTPTIKGFRD
jgi:signal recognition particle subunit SRP54